MPFVGKGHKMKVAALCLVAALAYGDSALAAERDPTPQAPATRCDTLAHVTSGFKGAKFTTLNAGQFHVIAGAWMQTPPVVGLPDADGAVLMQMGKKSVVLFTKGGLICLSEQLGPMPIGDKVLAALKSVNPMAGEKIDPPEDHKDDRSL